MNDHWWVKLGLVLLSVTVTLIILELALWISGFEPLRDLARGKDLVLRVSDNPAIGYELVPGTRGQAFKTDVVVNAYGFRGPDPKTGAVIRRVVSIGDSIAFGSELPGGTAYPDVLRVQLAERDPRFDVVNLALSGYDTLQEIAVLEHKGLRYQPEIVILGFCLNDAGIVSANAEYLDRIARYGESALITRSRLAQLAITRVDRWRGRTHQARLNQPEVFRANHVGRIDSIAGDETELTSWMADAPDRHPSAWYRDADRVGRIRYAFRRLATLAADTPFGVLVVVFPWLETDTSGAYPHHAAHRIVAHEAERQGLDVLDLTAAFSREGLVALRNAPEDATHPSPRGHEIAAREIVGWLSARGWIAPR